MKVLFVQGGSRWKIDSEGNLYTDSNFSNEIWKRYRNYCDDLTIILRSESSVYTPEDAIKQFNPFDKSLGHAVVLPDLYRPIKNAFNIALRKRIANMIEEEVKKADRLIIRSIGTYYTDIALKLAQRHNKPYVVEVTGFSWEAYWYHSFKGKFYAPFNEQNCKRLLRHVPYAIYVTQSALQDRYPCKEVAVGCSDVEIQSLDECNLYKRIERINTRDKNAKIVLGTAAFLDVGWKGQEFVIKALKILKDKGLSRFEYQLIGGGTGKKLKELAEKMGVQDEVTIIGSVSHEQVFSWMDGLDIYIQPSFMEGLCRSIVEAMSRACPVIASDVGGNYELVQQEFLFKKGNEKDLASKIISMLDTDCQISSARLNFEVSKGFKKEDLDRKRDKFYLEYLNR